MTRNNELLVFAFSGGVAAVFSCGRNPAEQCDQHTQPRSGDGKHQHEVSSPSWRSVLSIQLSAVCMCVLPRKAAEGRSGVEG